MIKEKSAGVIVFRKTKEGILFLLLRNSSRFNWDLPKGNIEQGESEEEAALREVKEESGLVKVKIIPGFKESIKYCYKMNGEMRDKEVIMFIGEEKMEEEVVISWEHDQYKWVKFEEAVRMLKLQRSDVIVRANNFLKSRLENFTN